MSWPVEAHLTPDLAKEKALQLLNSPEGVSPIAFSEFGTRRRRSFYAHDVVMRGLIEGFEEYKKNGGKGGVLSGTSNVSYRRDDSADDRSISR